MRGKSVLEMNADEARDFFLKTESYCSADLPRHFNFSQILLDVETIVGNGSYHEFKNYNPRGYDEVNYRFNSNKDGRTSWRSFQLIHPFLYVSMVNSITEESRWSDIKKVLAETAEDLCVECYSLPRESSTVEQDKAANIRNWWSEIEVKSISMAIDYEHLIHADISNFYDSIYTHSIPWSLHGKDVAKAQKSNRNLIGNVIDGLLQDMSYGQTNGIPQGSVLMDFISELLLAAIDKEVATLVCTLSNVRILRYRDDYRIFTNDSSVGARVLKILTEILGKYGLRLNSGKTVISQDIVRDSVKADRRSFAFRRRHKKNKLKDILELHLLAEHFPNSGTLIRELLSYSKFLLERPPVSIADKDQLVAISSVLIDIMYRNPKAIAAGSSVLSALLTEMDDDVGISVLKRVSKKIVSMPNSSFSEIWLQRVSLYLDHSHMFDEKLCRVVLGEGPRLWNSDWLKVDYRDVMSSEKIFDSECYLELGSVMQSEEVRIFEVSG